MVGGGVADMGAPERAEVDGFGGSGVADGKFWLPSGLTSDAEGRLWVADTWNARVQVFVIEPGPAVVAEGSR